MKIANRWEVPLIAATAGIALAAVSVLFLSARYIDSISASSQNNVVWDVMSAAPEVAMLQTAVAERFVPGISHADDEVELRFAILENRVKILKKATSTAPFDEESRGLVTLFAGVVDELRPQIQSLDAPAEAETILRELDRLNSQTIRLSATATASAAQRIATNQSQLSTLFWLLLAKVLALIGAGMALIFMLRRALRRADSLARVDFLTRLPNRFAFGKTLRSVFAEGEPLPGSVAVLMFDLDLFKHVNDTLGHAAGDRLLCSVAERLRPILADALMFARLSGDEFAVIFRSPAAESMARLAARQIIHAFEKPFDLEETQALSSASIGVAVLSRGDTSDDLLKNADLALYTVKDGQRNGFRFYESSMKEAFLARQTLAKDLETAIERDEFELRFQPVVNLHDGRTRAFEALLRWQHPERGSVPPGEFIPVAEETGQIVAIGDWVLRRACETAATWPDHVGITVNLSSRQFLDSSLQASILDALETSRLRPERLTLEITESVLIQNDQAVLLTLNELRHLGVCTALDDFGTGYASLSYLTRFPFDIIKIDQSFVRGSARQQNSQLIVQSIADLARKLGLTTVAEGIETAEQYEMVKAAGCNRGQGYLFDRPLTPADCAARLSLEAIAAVPRGMNDAAVAQPASAEAQLHASDQSRLSA
ncbi:putative bifunctional diguanylate cyclase/phosphodiesterase [Mangrovicella endophytica]|uniref:putative bifunctional diguanylate cyclase/phosphodiesterase n=1 Tax=Mangrovicella endophytica TaxID=2066697 RepID=UPI000C9DDCCE|nr:EAL domain-containing protein [Mangrovicella endophytica]